MHSINDQTLPFLTAYSIIVSDAGIVLEQSEETLELFGNLEQESIADCFDFLNWETSEVQNADTTIKSNQGFLIYHREQQKTMKALSLPIAFQRYALVLTPDKTQRQLATLETSVEVRNWSVLYQLAANLNVQLHLDGLVESIGRVLLAEMEYDCFHWSWLKENGIIAPSQFWMFKNGDPGPALKKKLSDGSNKLRSELNDRIIICKRPAFLTLDQRFLPYHHTLIIPIDPVRGRLGYIQMYSSAAKPKMDSGCHQLVDLLYGEINRQFEQNLAMESERNQVVQLAQASRLSSLGAMAGGIAHEINNPITIIMGMLTKTIRELGGQQPIQREDMKAVLVKAKEYTERINKIVKGIRALSRDGARDAFASTKIQEIIDNTLALCDSSLKNNEIQLTYDLEDPDLIIQCRPVQISQVILNLIHNSIDAIGDQDNPWIHLGVNKSNDDTVEFSITDSGNGIPDEIAIRLMEPFFTTKGAGKGTGLGLSVSKEIIKAHSGTFSLDRDFQNTRFVIQLPLNQETKKAEAS